MGFGGSVNQLYRPNANDDTESIRESRASPPASTQMVQAYPFQYKQKRAPCVRSARSIILQSSGPDCTAMAIMRTWGADLDLGSKPSSVFYALSRLPREPIISWAQRYQVLARRAQVMLWDDIDAWRRFKATLNKDDPEWVAIVVKGGKGALDEVLDTRVEHGRKRPSPIYTVPEVTSAGSRAGPGPNLGTSFSGILFSARRNMRKCAPFYRN